MTGWSSFTQILDSEPQIERILQQSKEALGDDFEAYRHHVYRLFNLAVHLSAATGKDRLKLATAAAFHRIAIWSHESMDYVQPSIEAAARFLAETKRKDWIFDVSLMISEHHKLSKFRGPSADLVNAFRVSVWMDITCFKLPHRVHKPYIESLLESFPRMGFHKRLWELARIWAFQHPFRPLPMVKF